MLSRRRRLRWSDLQFQRLEASKIVSVVAGNALAECPDHHSKLSIRDHLKLRRWPLRHLEPILDRQLDVEFPFSPRSDYLLRIARLKNPRRTRLATEQKGHAHNQTQTENPVFKV